MIREDRNIALFILLSIVTCGIYPLVFWYQVADDMNKMCDGDGEKTQGGGLLILLFLCTCGIYQFIWFYQLAERLQKNGAKFNLEFSEDGTTVLLWMLLGSLIIVGPYIAYYFMINNLNKLAAAYNKGLGTTTIYN